MKQLLAFLSESPMSLLEQYLEAVHIYFSLLPELLAVWENQNWEKASLVQQQMEVCLLDIQEIKRSFMMESTSEWFYPFSEKEIKTSLGEIQLIVKETGRIVELVMERKIHCPDNVIHNYYGYIYACLNMLETIQQLFARFSEIKNATRQEQRHYFQKMWLRLEQSRDDISQIHREVHRDLNKVEKNMSILDAVFLHQIFERTNNIATKAQQVGMMCLQSI